MKNQKVVPIHSDVPDALCALSDEFSNLLTLLDLLENHVDIAPNTDLCGAIGMARDTALRIWNRIDVIADGEAGGKK